MAGLTVTTAAPKHCSHLEPRKGRPPLRRSGSHPRLRRRGPRTPPSARHSWKGTSTPSFLHRLNAPEPQLPGGCTEPGLSLRARACSSRWGSRLGTVPLAAKPEPPPTASGQATHGRRCDLCRLSTHADKTEAPTVASCHGVIKDDKSQEVGEEGKREHEDEESNLPPPGNRTVTYSFKADDEDLTEKRC